MAWLYWSCPQDAVDPLREQFAAKGKRHVLRERGDQMPVVCVAEPDDWTIALIVRLIGEERVMSAALTTELLVEGKLWIATEWWHCIVADPGQVGRLQVVGGHLEAPTEASEQGLLIFRIRGSPWSRRLVERAERRIESAEQVRARPRDFYGELADPLVGGANVLYAAGLEAARTQLLSDEHVFVGPPEAFGFMRDGGESSVAALAGGSIIAADAVGFGLGSATEVRDLFARHEVEFDPDDIAAKMDVWQELGFRFGLGLVLRGLQDPPVVIPVGAAYQQPAFGATMQNLAVAQPAQVLVAAGATVPLILPAWCLNPTFAPPSGPLTPTPLISTVAGGTQQRTWDDIRAGYWSN